MKNSDKLSATVVVVIVTPSIIPEHHRAAARIKQSAEMPDREHGVEFGPAAVKCYLCQLINPAQWMRVNMCLNSYECILVAVVVAVVSARACM